MKHLSIFIATLFSSLSLAHSGAIERLPSTAQTPNYSKGARPGGLRWVAIDLSTGEPVVTAYADPLVGSHAVTITDKIFRQEPLKTFKFRLIVKKGQTPTVQTSETDSSVSQSMSEVRGAPNAALTTAFTDVYDYDDPRLLFSPAAGNRYLKASSKEGQAITSFVLTLQDAQPYDFASGLNVIAVSMAGQKGLGFGYRPTSLKLGGPNSKLSWDQIALAQQGDVSQAGSGSTTVTQVALGEALSLAIPLGSQYQETVRSFPVRLIVTGGVKALNFTSSSAGSFGNGHFFFGLGLSVPFSK